MPMELPAIVSFYVGAAHYEQKSLGEKAANHKSRMGSIASMVSGRTSSLAGAVWGDYASNGKEHLPVSD